MLVARQLRDVPFEKNSVVSVGSFDGVHRAHTEIIREVVRRAHMRKGRSVIVTFDPHPKQVLLDTKDIRLLSTLEERRRICDEMGVDVFFAIPFTYEFSRQSSREFYERYIVNGTGVREVVEGYDHHFGRDREGSIKELRQMGGDFGFSLVTVNPVSLDGEVVNSSAIRRHLHEGNVARASELLGRPYRIEGVVVRGKGRGKQLGYPTANIAPLNRDKMIPANGVYVVRVAGEGVTSYGLANIGTRPTFETAGTQTLEVHLLAYEGTLYDVTLEVRFLKRLRNEMKFETPADLIRQIDSDKEAGFEFIQQFEHTTRTAQEGGRH